MLLLQNLGLLFNMLPSETTPIDNIIQIVWVGKISTQSEQLSQFVTVQIYCIINTLHWLIANNLLYKAIEINYCLFDIWDDEFISLSITNNVANYNPKHYKRLGYVANLCEDNYKNDFYTAITDTKIEGDHIHSSCVYGDIDDEKQNLTLRLLSAIGNIKVIDLTSDTTSPLVISYCNKGQLFLLNDWENPHYFTTVFFYSFLTCIKGHLEEQKQTMSIEA